MVARASVRVCLCMCVWAMMAMMAILMVMRLINAIIILRIEWTNAFVIVAVLVVLWFRSFVIVEVKQEEIGKLLNDSMIVRSRD